MRWLSLDLARLPARQILLSLAVVNLALTATTALFIYEYARVGQWGPRGQAFVKYLLVQFHLGTENVLAAWYSSMLLMTVALLALGAFLVDRHRRHSRLLHYGWLLFATTFVVLSFDELASFHERIGMVDRLAAGVARGWVYILALPIAMIAIFMIGFAWLHVRRVRPAFRLLVIGVTVFATNPVLESIELAMLDSGPGTWQMLVHDTLLVIEEGVVELMATLCFAAGIFSYMRGTSRAVRIPLPSYPLLAGVAMAALMLVAMMIALRLAAAMPRGDTGIPHNWFPAVSLLCLSYMALAMRAHLASGAERTTLIHVAILSLAVSAAFGAGLLGYTRWWPYGQHAAMAATIAAWLGIGAMPAADGVRMPRPADPYS